MKYREDQYYIERIRAGASGEFEPLVNKYKTYAFTLALKIVRNREDAEEVA
ncbi:MAG: hypothetical protein H6585_09175 [Flavobacteriales bacterium]|nr:hypothetical protein [Flavobacteriales bacterium]MCB9448500.1 hypothetical protein [Flavobacteriales bacterium]